MSNPIKSRKGFIVEVFLVVFVIIIATVFIAMSKLGRLSFAQNVIKVTLSEEMSAKLFSLFSNTVAGYTMENLMGYAVLTGPSLEKPVAVDVSSELAARMGQISGEAGTNYYLFVTYGNRRVLEARSADSVPAGATVLKYNIPLPYNNVALTAEVNLVEWA